jgi:hypothetical protein
MMNFVDFFTTFGALAAATTVVAELVNRFWVLDGVGAQVRSLALAILLGVGGAVFHMGFFADPLTLFGTMNVYLGGAVIGLAAGVIANWSFATPIVKFILEFLKIRVPADPAAKP